MLTVIGMIESENWMWAVYPDDSHIHYHNHTPKTKFISWNELRWEGERIDVKKEIKEIKERKEKKIKQKKQTEQRKKLRAEEKIKRLTEKLEQAKGKKKVKRQRINWSKVEKRCIN